MSSFEDLRVVDNFYQTSLFFPMPTVVISTLCEDGTTTLGPYSLVQPYYVAGKEFYAMLLSCRNSSNTAQNILRSGKCAINFVDDKPKTFKECVKLSWPGDKPEDKMPSCAFKLEKGQAEGERPMVLTDAIQVIECTWVRELDGAQDDKPGELHGYEPPYHDFNGELVWKKGMGIMTAMHYIRVDYYATEIHLFGWVQSGIGDAGFGEMDLEGFVGCIPKKAVLKVMNQITLSV